MATSVVLATPWVIEKRSNSAAVIPISDYKIVNARKLSSSWVRAHFAAYHTTHNRASYAVCKICYDFKDNNGTVHVKNDTNNTKDHAELRASLNPANASAVILLHDWWPVAVKYEIVWKLCVLYCRFFVLFVTCRLVAAKAPLATSIPTGEKINVKI